MFRESGRSPHSGIILFDYANVSALSPWQFHALLNPLFRVLFNFPSRYLFAIGLAVIFSFRWSFPPLKAVFSNNPTLERTPTTIIRHRSYGAITLYGQCVIKQFGLPDGHHLVLSQTWHPIDGPTHSLGGLSARLHAELLPFHSPLLEESLLISFPPHNDMLKFCGWSLPKRGWLFLWSRVFYK